MSPFISVETTLTISVPASFNEHQVRQWLMTDGFQFDQPGYLERCAESFTIHEPTESLILHWLFFHQQILIAAGVPYFKQAEINQISKVSEQRYQVILVLSPIVDFQPLVINSLPACLALLYYMNDTPFDWDAYATLSNKIHHELYLPLRKASSSGMSNIPILRYAYEQDIPFMYCGAGLYQLGWGSNSHLLHNSSTEQDSAIGATLSGYKNLSANRLRSMGLPAAVNRLADTLERARAVAKELGYPVVIKPERGNRGEGVVKDIGNDDQLLLAWKTATAFNPSHYTQLIAHEPPSRI